MPRTDESSASAVGALGPGQLWVESHPSIIGEPLYAGNEFRIVGVALGHAPVADVRVEIGDLVVHAARELPSPWTPGADAPGVGRAGFEARIDLRGLPAGSKPLRIVVVGEDGSELRTETSIEVEPFEPPTHTPENTRANLEQGAPAMWCEEPWLDGSGRSAMPVRVQGWAWGEAGIDRVTVTVDGKVRVLAGHGIRRADLRDQLGDRVADEGGFAVTLDPSECGPGEHTLTVVAHDSTGRAVGVEGKLYVLSELPPSDGEPGPDISSERYVPELHVGYSFEPEHHARYRWAAALAPGRTVLDAGCGTGFGTEILARSGALGAKGFDASLVAVRHAQERAGEVADFMLGDLLKAPFPDGGFDLITCFEAIEHVADPHRALDELCRMLTPAGVLLVSTPNRGVAPAGNPHHLHELSAEEFETALGERFAHVRLFRQQSHVASLLAARETAASSDVEASLDLDVRIVGEPTKEDLYLVAAASNEPLPPLGEILVLGQAIDLAQSLDAERTATERALVAEERAAAARVAAAAASAARHAALRERDEARAETTRERAAHADAAEGAARARAETDAARAQVAAVQATRWWRAGAPLRWLRARRRGS